MKNCGFRNIRIKQYLEITAIWSHCLSVLIVLQMTVKKLIFTLQLSNVKHSNPLWTPVTNL